MPINGYIKLHRKLLEWEWYQDSNTLRLFIHCLLNANHKESQWKGLTISTGSFVTSSIKLSEELGLSRGAIRNSLAKLIQASNITINTTNKYTVINVVNWALYQIEDGEPSQQNNQQHAIHKPSKSHKQEYKEEKELKDKKILNTIFGELETQEKDKIPYKEIVEYLNAKTKMNLKHTTNKTRDLIKARWNEGFKLDDFKKAIDNAVRFRTKSNGEIETRYLQPKTLFNGSFESRVLGSAYKFTPNDKEKDHESLEGRYDKFITRG